MYSQVSLLCFLSPLFRKFVDVLDLKKHETCVKEASLLDYFIGGFWWTIEMGFTCQQTSFIMALLQLMLDNIKSKSVTGFVHSMDRSLWTYNQ